VGKNLSTDPSLRYRLLNLVVGRQFGDSRFPYTTLFVRPGIPGMSS
jgi:hypothetical protein